MPRAKLPLSFSKVLLIAIIKSKFFKKSVSKNVITSVSVCDLNLYPFFSKSFFNSFEFSIIPLWTIETSSDECGCALTSFGTPCVAHLTWTSPKEPSVGFLNSIFYKLSTLPVHFFSSISPFWIVAIPA